VERVYTALPKRSGAKASYNNLTRLRSIVRTVHGKPLARVPVSHIGPRLWADFMAKRQGGQLDLSTRRAENAAINAAVRCASSIFIPRLRPLYREAGIIIPDDAKVIQWLPEMRRPRPKADDAAMVKAWLALPRGPLFWTAGLARFAGLRREEISACRREWISEDETGVFVEMHDRPEYGWLTKTGEVYRARIMRPDFAAALLALPPGPIVEIGSQCSRSHWFEHKPQEWLKAFTGAARKPLHRLRGLYADDVKRTTEEAVKAHLAGIREASKNLGHTNTATTERSYLSHALH
jgi:hypothetical protein